MRSATRRSTPRKEASESDHGGDLNIELMMDETLGSEEKAVWTGFGLYGPSCRSEVEPCGTYMKKLLWMQCLRDFGCVATCAWESCDHEE